MTIGEALNISATGFIVVLIILALLACIIVVLSKVIRVFDGDKKSKINKNVEVLTSVSAPAKAETSAPAPQVQLPTGLELYKTSEKTAATIMAIVSHQSGIPLDRLLFKSIKLIEK